MSDWDISNVQVTGSAYHEQATADIFRGTTLSTANQDAILVSWGTQAVNNNITNIPFHIGVKSYSATGAAGLESLESLGWTITQQYQAEYSPSSDAILSGTSVQSIVDATTTAVTISPNKRCTFVQWSDGRTDNPRTDVLSDNLYVQAQLSCSSGSSGTSARAQVKKATEFGNTERAEVVKERFLTTTSTPATDETLEETLERVKQVPLSLNNLDPVKDREVIKDLIKVLLELVKALTLLMMGTEEQGGEV